MKTSTHLLAAVIGSFSGLAAAQTEFADVISSVPVYQTVQIDEPKQVCREVEVVTEQAQGAVTQRGAAGAAIGAIAGGVAGHQFGGGRGKDAATIGGAVLGGVIGHQVAKAGEAPPQSTTRTEQRCDTVTSSRQEQRLSGYNVSYRYAGRTYQSMLPHDPGSRLAVNVSVTPASAPAATTSAGGTATP
jgi:uncharacterized protein YcfJ